MGSNKSVGNKSIRDLLSEKDAFLTTSEKFYEFFLHHTKGLIVAGIAVVLTIIGTAFYFNFQEAAEVKASIAYEEARALIGVSADQQNLAVSIAALEGIRQQYATGKVARLATFDLVGLYGASGELDKSQVLAEGLLHSLKESEASLKPLLLSSLGGLYEAGGDYVKAAKSYEMLVTMTFNEPDMKENVLMSLGRVQVAAGQKEVAIKYYEELIASFPDSYNALLANYRIAQLTGKPVAFPLPKINSDHVASSGSAPLEIANNDTVSASAEGNTLPAKENSTGDIEQPEASDSVPN